MCIVPSYQLECNQLDHRESVLDFCLFNTKDIALPKVNRENVVAKWLAPFHGNFPLCDCVKYW